MTANLFTLVVCLAIFTATPAPGQQQATNFKNFNPRFEVFELPGGTLGNSVQAIAQDSTGFLWFGSQGGLHRYDGQNIRTIRHDPAVGKVDVIPQDMGRVLLNLINNAFYAVSQRALVGAPLGGPQPADTRHAGAHEGHPYEPIVTVSTQKTDNQTIIKVKDNGTGIPDEVKARISQPFFTTNPTGQGTGLGLSLAYDIVTKGYGGRLEVESVEREETALVIQLPC